MLLKLSEVFHQPGVGGKLSHLPPGLQEVVAGKDHRADEHVRVNQVVVHHDHALLQLGLAVQDRVHLLASVVVELDHLTQQVKTTLYCFFLSHLVANVRLKQTCFQIQFVTSVWIKLAVMCCKSPRRNRNT